MNLGLSCVRNLLNLYGCTQCYGPAIVRLVEVALSDYILVFRPPGTVVPDGLMFYP